MKLLRLLLAVALSGAVALSAAAAVAAESPPEQPQEAWARIEKALQPDCAGINLTASPEAADAELPSRAIEVTARPTRFELHRSLSCLEAPLQEPVSVVLDCIWTSTPRPGDWGGALGLEDCRADPAVRADVARVAVLQAPQHVIAYEALESPQPRYRTRLTVRVDLADRMGTPPRDYSAAPIDSGRVDWLESFTPAEWKDLYPPRMLRQEQQGFIVALCLIRERGRLRCTDTLIGPSYRRELLSVLDPIERRYRAAPKLRDGQPSTGRWVVFRINFSLPE